MNGLLEMDQPQMTPGSHTDAHRSDPAPGRRYILITPCRDESDHAHTTIQAVLNQTERPAKWVIVNDGSTDNTGQILDEYARDFDFIEVIHRQNRGERKLGSGVIEAFNVGLENVNLDEYDFVCKFDLDLNIPAGYFAKLMDMMHADERLGACSGKPYFYKHERKIAEPCGDEHAVGMTKFYRVECFKQIGGFVPEVMWDGIDTHRSRMLGWKAGSWSGEHLDFIHLRAMGSSDKSLWKGRVRHGRGQWYMGTGPTYLAASVAYRLFSTPAFVGSAGITWGYLKSMFTGEKRYDHPGFRAFLRHYHRLCMTRGKSEATRIIEAEYAKQWKSETASKR